MFPLSRQDWADMLERTASGVLSEASLPGRFADEFGHSRDVDGPFLAWRASRGADVAAPEVGEPAEGADPDVVLWTALVRPRADLEAWLLVRRGDLGRRDPHDAGALFGQRSRVPIEVWTEVELSSLHALSWLTRRNEGASLRALVDGVAGWHVENMQPDNATNHPWAVHVFVDLAARTENADAMLYAQTLLHNCQVSLGRPDRLSAHILADAADWLRTPEAAV